MWQQESAEGGVIAAVSTGSAPAQKQIPQIALSSLQLFSNTQADDPGVQQSTEDLPETNLQLTLRGVLAAAGDFAGSALFEDDRNNTDAYLVGDTLPGNATLRSVHPARIIIERSGKLENLYFPEIDNRSGFSIVGDETQSLEPAYTPPARPQPALSQADLSQPTSASTAPTDEQRRAEIREKLEQLRHSLRNGG
ncbi:type II secretion system protein N [Marinobacter gelidimuriae]|uniref:type II secretion system protein N n=1 Tax=Marinobacter gelidimuriae TaxID=2739064 RepID=UPI00035E0A1A|nr:type II secretion system protein N [Marinobacter gelidimuriae]